MKIASIILLSLLFSVCYSQNSFFPTLRNYSYLDSTHYWETSNINEQQKKWSNGKVKLEYEHINDSLRLRKEYFESGNLKFTAEVYQKWRSDTIISGCYIGGETFYIRSGFEDKMHGEYIEYYDWNQIKIRTTGQFLHGKMTGAWTTKTGEGALIEAQYDNEGFLDGLYVEYYYKKNDPKALTKWKGQYKLGDQDGLWEYFDMDGKLLERITYKWIRN